MESILRQKYFLGFFILVFLGNLLIYNPQVALWDEDEAAYAGFALNMIESGDWLNPDFFWSKKHQKPPLHFWTIAISYKIFGVNEFATRLPSVLAAIFTLLAMVFLGGRAFGRDKAKLAALVLASTLIFPALAKIAFTDMTLLLFETITALSLFLFVKKQHWLYSLLFWSGIAFGALVKGPPVLILGLGIWGFLFLFKSTRPAMIRLHPWFFLPLALLPLFAWGYFSWQKDGGKTVNFLIDWYILRRVGGSGTVLGQTGPPGYHFAVMLIAFLPVLSFFPAALKDLWVNLKKREKEALFFAGWLIFGWLFYEIMPSKLPSYAVGAYPAIAFLIAWQFDPLLQGEYPYKKWIKTSSIFFMILMFSVVVAVILGSYMLFGRTGFMRAIFAGTVLWGLGLFAAISLFSDNFRSGITSSLVFGVLLTFLSWWAIMPLLDNERSINRKVSYLVNEKITGSANLAIGNDISEDPSLAFYLETGWDGNYYHQKDLGKIISGFNSDSSYSALTGSKWHEQITNEFTGDSTSLNSIEVKGRASESLEPVSYFLIWKE